MLSTARLNAAGYDAELRKSEPPTFVNDMNAMNAMIFLSHNTRMNILCHDKQTATIKSKPPQTETLPSAETFFCT